MRYLILLLVLVGCNSQARTPWGVCDEMCDSHYQSCRDNSSDDVDCADMYNRCITACYGRY